MIRKVAFFLTALIISACSIGERTYTCEETFPHRDVLKTVQVERGFIFKSCKWFQKGERVDNNDEQGWVQLFKGKSCAEQRAVFSTTYPGVNGVTKCHWDR